MISIRYKAFIPAGLLGAVLIALTSIAHFAITQLTNTNASLAGRYHEIEEVRHIEVAVNRLVYPLVATLMVESPEARDSVTRRLDEIRDMIGELRELAVVNSEEHELLNIIDNRLTHIEGISGIMLRLPPSEHQRAMAMLNDLTAYQLTQLSDLIHTWHEDEARQVNELQEASAAVGDRFRWWTGLFASALAMLLIFALWLNNRILVKPVMTISRSTSKLAAGELESHITLKANDELGGLAADINNMAASLQSVHQRLEAMANSDSLTGLLNRRAFEAIAPREFEAARRYRRKLAIAILDLDHFKLVNDTHGHKSAMRCCEPWPISWRRHCGKATMYSALAARSSYCCCRKRTNRAP